MIRRRNSRMARTRGPKRNARNTVFPYRSNNPCMEGLLLQQHDLDLVDPSRSGNRVSDELKEDDGDQETEADGDLGVKYQEEEEEKDQEGEGKGEGEGEDGRFGVDNATNGNSEPEGTSWDSSDPEQEENDNKTGMARLRLWLDLMGLKKYEPLFELHDVDDEVLQLLTLKDLKDMGVSSVGLRWKIYTYVQESCK